MDITPYVEALRRDLQAAAEAGSDEARSAADRMLPALEPAVRLVLMEALSQAAAEITAELDTGVVEVRLRGRDPELVVTPHPASAHAQPAGAPAPPPEDEADDGATARLTLRLPESVKTRAEELAGRSGYSLNSWIVGVLKSATSPLGMNLNVDLSGMPFLDPYPRGRRMSGWV